MRARRKAWLLLVSTMVALVPLASIEASEPTLKGYEELPSGLYRMIEEDGTVSYSHGYDPADHGSWSWISKSLKRQPICSSDYYVHVLYGRLSSRPDGFNSRKNEILNAVKNTNYLLNSEAVESGGHNADFKVLCDQYGEIEVGSFASSTEDFYDVKSAARAAGYNKSNVKYWIFFDTPAQSYSGISDLYPDSSASKFNLNNSGGMYSVTHYGYWDTRTPLHEIGHSMGAVQEDAPYSTGNGYHCYEDVDVMCYNDGGNKDPGYSVDNCLDHIHFDCGHDSYFDSSTEAGEYLASHWNLADPFNRFIAFDGNPLPPANRPPVAQFFWQCTATTCSFIDQAFDLDTPGGGVSSVSWDFGDGTTSSVARPDHTYANPGKYMVKMTATDVDGASSDIIKSVGAYTGDPDPSALTLLSEDRRDNQTVGPTGSWAFYKVLITEQMESLTITIGGPACAAYWPCDRFLQSTIPQYGYPFGGANLDLYVRSDAKPDLTSWSCRSTRPDSADTCTISSPPGGILYIGVYSYWRYAQDYGWTYYIQTERPWLF